MGKAIQSLAYKMQTVEELQQDLDGLTTDAVEARVVRCHILGSRAVQPLLDWIHASSVTECFTSIDYSTRLCICKWTEFHLVFISMPKGS